MLVKKKGKHLKQKGEQNAKPKTEQEWETKNKKQSVHRTRRMEGRARPAVSALTVARLCNLLYMIWLCKREQFKILPRTKPTESPASQGL